MKQTSRRTTIVLALIAALLTITKASATAAQRIGDSARQISLQALEAELREQPPISVGFDVDDTVLLSSPCFQQGKEKHSPGSNDYLSNPTFWNELDRDCDITGQAIDTARTLISFHQQRGDDIYFVTGRIRPEQEKLTAQLAALYGISNPHPVIFAGTAAKSFFLHELNIKIFYGDSDDDVLAALDIGARPIRFLRSHDSTRIGGNSAGFRNEEVLLDTGH